MLAKLTGNKMILGAVVGILGGLVVAVVLVTVLSVGRGPAAPVEAAKAEARPVAATAKGASPVAKFGYTYQIRDRLVNLADPGGRRYLRFSVALEFAAIEEKKSDAPERSVGGYQLALYVPERDDVADQPIAEGGKDPEKEFQARVKKYAPALEDVVTTVLSSKTYADISTSDGKELAKKEIKDRCQRLLGDEEHITNVYFTEFVIQ